MGITNGGCYAELLTVHERQTISVPKSLPIENAGALPEVYITAWDALVRQGGLTAGRWALVHAGASGVGTASIQIAKAIGAKIIVTASAGKHKVCQGLGADVIIDYNKEDFVEIVKTETGKVGVDVVLDVIGGTYLPRNVSSVKTGGKIIQVGVMQGSPVDFNPGSLLMKRASLTGTTLRARPIEEKISITQEFSFQMSNWIADGTLSPVIDSQFSLEKIADAHTRMSKNENAGKILIGVQDN